MLNRISLLSLYEFLPWFYEVLFSLIFTSEKTCPNQSFYLLAEFIYYGKIGITFVIIFTIQCKQVFSSFYVIYASEMKCDI